MTPYRFDRLEVSPLSRQVWLDGRPVAIRARAFDVLHALIERRDRVVSKDELLGIAWPNVIVEENNLQVQISALRRALGHDIITTVAGRGYQFSTGDATSGNRPPKVAIKPTKVPRPITSFIGRENDLVSCARLIGESRLVTLIGIGGSGKTRVAIELAQHVSHSFADGVCFVDLSALQAGAEVWDCVLAALGHAGASAAGASLLVDLLSKRELLLVLDNCEHVLASSSGLIRSLLESADGVKVLATSRAPFEIPGELTAPVLGLSVPPPTIDSEPDDLASYESVQLLIARVRLLWPDFTLDHRNAPAVAALCRQLDGIPLAIELAAARAKILSIEQIVAMLDRRFRLLVGGASFPPRHRVLHAVIAWSYEQLEADEQRVARQLSVFSGGWTLEAASAIAAPQGTDTLAVLGRLVDMSLVYVIRGDSSSRYGMLETVRLFMEECLVQASELQHARTRHLRFYLALAEAIEAERARLYEANPDAYPPMRRGLLDKIGIERQNLLSAHNWCDVAENGAELGLRLINAVRMYWIFPSARNARSGQDDQLGQGYDIERHALSRLKAQTHDPAACDALLTASQLSFRQYRFEESRAQLEQSLAIARELRAADRIWRRVADLASVCRYLGDWPSAMAYAEETLTLARASGKGRRIANAMFLLAANTYAATGNYVGAKDLMQQALTAALESSRMADAATCLLNLALMAIDEGRLEEARSVLLRSIKMSREIQADEWTRCAIELSASLAAAHGDYLSSARFFGASDELAKELRTWRDPEDRAFAARWMQLSLQSLGEERFRDTESMGRSLGLMDAAVELSKWLTDAAPT